MIFTIILFIAVLGVLVFAHEFGHFIAAKRAGVRVDEFGFGFPPRVWGKQVGETLYSINLIPLGGFVRVWGEDGDGNDDPRSFVQKPFFVRQGILLAGVAMNFVLAIFLFSLIYVIGVPSSVSDDAAIPDARVFISGVAPGSPAEEAGLRTNDMITSISVRGAEYAVTKVTETQQVIAGHAGMTLGMEILRGKERTHIEVTPRVSPPEGEGPLGVQLLRAGTVMYPWYEAPWRGFWTATSMSITLVEGTAAIFGQLFTTGTLHEGVGGPLAIFYFTGQASALGFANLLSFMAIISLNLMILNALPIPALDGGRAFIALLERLRNKNFSQRALVLVNGTAFVLLLAFATMVTILRDLPRYYL